MEFIFTVVFRGLFFCTAAHFKIYSHSQTPIFPFSKPVQALLGKKWKKVKPFLSCQSVPCRVISCKNHIWNMHLCAKVALASKVLQDLKLRKPDCPVAKPWGEKKDPPAITQITSLVLFFPTSWQQLTTPSEVQLSYHYKTFHSSQKNKDTQNRILLLITWYISAYKKEVHNYSCQTFELMICHFVVSDCFANVIEYLTCMVGQIVDAQQSNKRHAKNIHHSGAVLFSLPVQGQLG